MTASPMSGDKEKCLAAGMDDYIAKPIEIDIIQQKLQQWTNKTNANEVEIVSEDMQRTHKNTVNHPIFDYQALSNRLSGNESIISKVCMQFIPSIKKTIIELNSVISKKQYDPAKKLAHNLKGASATIGCMQMNAIAIKIENDLKEDIHENLGIYVKELNQNFMQSKQAIEEKIQ